MKRWLLICVLLLSQSVLLAQQQQVPEADFWGMVVRDPLYEWGSDPAHPDQVNRQFIDAMLTTLAGMGVQWVRFEIHGDWGGEWGQLRLNQADYFITAAHARGIKVLMLLGTDLLKHQAPFLTLFDDPNTFYDPLLGYEVNGFMQQWLTRALDVAATYAGRVDAYELFNEPNYYFALRDETSGAEDQLSSLYLARTIAKFARITRDRGDTTPLILGGLHPMTSQQTGLSDRQYLRALYTDASFTNYHTARGSWPVAGIGYHPYPAEMRRIVSDNDFLYLIGPRLDALIDIINDYDSGARLWLTEIGTRGNPGDQIDLERQAAFLRDLVGIFRQPVRRSSLGPWFWFKYEDFPGETWGVVTIPFDSQGHYVVDGQISLYKPAYTQYRRMALDIQVQPRMYIPLMLR